MLCLGCGQLGAALCPSCEASLVQPPDRMLAHGLLVRTAYVHEGAARSLVQALKYRGSDRAGWLLGRAMCNLIPAGTTLVPLPRARWRTLTYGIDPAPDFSRRIAALTGLPQWRGLRPPLRHPAQAGRSRSERQPPMFSVMSPPPPGPLVLIDDVVTTGRTLAGAHAALAEWGGRVMLAVTATATSD